MCNFGFNKLFKPSTIEEVGELLMSDSTLEFNSGRHMPSYESSINKDKTPAKILQKLEIRLRTPFIIDMETEIAAISDLIFALQSESTPKLKDYTKEVMEVRSQLIMNKEFMSRRELAKLLAALLPPQAKLGIIKRLKFFITLI